MMVAGGPTNQQHLIFAAKQLDLDDSWTLSKYNIREEFPMLLVLCLGKGMQILVRTVMGTLDVKAKSQDKDGAA